MAALKGANGGFVATWQDNSFLRGDDTRSGSIVAQRFDNAGNKVGGEILVDTKGINFVNDVNNVVGLANGGFAVTWQAQSNSRYPDAMTTIPISSCRSSTPAATRSAPSFRSIPREKNTSRPRRSRS